MGGLAAELHEFYELRSNVLHSPQMPFDVESGFLKIPLVATTNKSAKEWDDRSHWNGIDSSTFVYLADFVRETVEDFVALVNRLHPAISEGARRFFRGLKVDWSKRTTMPSSRSSRSVIGHFGLGACSANIGMGGFRAICASASVYWPKER